MATRTVRIVLTSNENDLTLEDLAEFVDQAKAAVDSVGDLQYGDVSVVTDELSVDWDV